MSTPATPEDQLAEFVLLLPSLKLDADGCQALVATFARSWGMLYRQNLLLAIDAELDAAALEPEAE